MRIKLSNNPPKPKPTFTKANKQIISTINTRTGNPVVFVNGNRYEGYHMPTFSYTRVGD